LENIRWIDEIEEIEEIEDLKIMYKNIETIFDIFDSSFSIKEAREKFNILFENIYKDKMFKNKGNWENLKFKENKTLEWNKKIIELENAIKTIKNHFEWILNYFNWRLTNWYAEWLNSRIQRVLSNTRWFKDKTYMLYRIIKIFS